MHSKLNFLIWAFGILIVLIVFLLYFRYCVLIFLSVFFFLNLQDLLKTADIILHYFQTKPSESELLESVFKLCGFVNVTVAVFV